MQPNKKCEEEQTSHWQHDTTQYVFLRPRLVQAFLDAGERCWMSASLSSDQRRTEGAPQ